MTSVDVFVPCYRYGRFLRKCVESVLAQDLPVRVLIIDDASPDDSAEVAGELALKHPQVSFVRHTANKGHIATYNEGIEWTAAEYMLLLSADDYLLPGAFRRATALMDANPDVGFSFGRTVDLVKGSERQLHTRANAAVRMATNAEASRVLRGSEFFQLIALSQSLNIVRTPTAIVRTRTQKRVGGYRQDLPHAGDLEMWLRLASHGAVGVVNAYQAVYRLHGANMQNSHYRERHLPDLQQRKAAIDCVFASRGHHLPNGQDLHQKLLRPLAGEALGLASSALNDGDRANADRLAAFALSIEPSIRRSLPWIVLGSKKWLGVRATRVVTRAATRLRQLSARPSWP